MGTVSNATPLDDKDIVEICLMYRNGRKLRDIQEVFHISYNRLKRILREQDVERKTKPSRGTPLEKDVLTDVQDEYWGIPLRILEDWDVARMILTGERMILTRMKKRFCRGKIPGCVIIDWLEKNQRYKWKKPVIRKKR